MKYILMIACILCLFAKCKSRSDCEEDLFTKEFSKGDFDSGLPPANSNLLIFLRLKSNKIVSAKNFIVNQIYKGKNSNVTFRAFICDLFSEKILLREDDFKQNTGRDFFYGETDDSVKKIYEEKGLSEIISKYFNLPLNGVIILKSGLSNNQQYTILYYMFLNKYFITYSDYDGSYHLAKQF